MSWFGKYTYMGLEIVRISFGERAYDFVLRFCKKRRDKGLGSKGEKSNDLF